jgi:hypothetical protein
MANTGGGRIEQLETALARIHRHAILAALLTVCSETKRLFRGMAPELMDAIVRGMLLSH